MIERRRLLLMRHGAVDYFDDAGRPWPNPDQLPLTAAGEAQARSAGRAFAAAGLRIDCAITSGLARTRATAEALLDAAAASPPVEHWPQLQEIRAGRLPAIADADLEASFLRVFQGPVPREVRFLDGESIGELQSRVLPAIAALLARSDWDTALVVAHGGVNRAVLSWFLTGEPTFLGGLGQDAGCVNIIDVGPTAATSVIRVVNFCPADALRTETRLSTMEQLLLQYLKLRGAAAS